VIGLFERALLVAATACLFGAALASALVPATPLVRALPPRARALCIEAILFLPWLAPAVLLGAGLAPSLMALLWPSVDHCQTHDDHHDHLCLLHPPPAAHDLSTVLACLVLGAVAVRLLGLLPRIARAHHAARQLLDAGQRGAGGVWSLPTDLPVVAVVGAWTQAVVVSDGARRRVSPETLEIALAHERAHVTRRDLQRGVLVTLAGAAHGPETFAHWVADLSVAREQACDEAAADHVGDRIRVAEAILEVARAMSDTRLLREHASFERASIAFGVDALEARIQSLLADRPRLSLTALVAFGAIGALLVAALPTVHHVLESLLELTH
jgi:hypothetical protein